MISDDKITNSLHNLEKELKSKDMYAAYDDLSIIKQALVERDRKIFGLKQTIINLDNKLSKIGGYHYGNPK